MSARVSYKKQFIFGLMLLLTIGIIFEGAARIYEIPIHKCAILDSGIYDELTNEENEKICSDHGKILFIKPDITQNKPNQHYEMININSLGFRGGEIQKEKETFRIFVVGGSTVFGGGSSSDETTISGYLQEFFDNDIENKIEVINAGISGANSVREEFLIKNYLLELKPDLIIIYDGWNDADNAIKNQIDIGAPNSEDKIKNSLKNIFLELMAYYRTPHVINYVINESQTSIDYDENRLEKMSDTWKNRWEGMCSLGNNEGFKTMIFLQPILGTGNKELTPYEEKLSKMDESISVRYALEKLKSPLNELNDSCELTKDLTNIFDGIKEPMYFDYGHVGDKGNKIIAKEIFESILPSIYEK